MLNLVYIKKIDALPKGVERVEIGNWTKTRETDEINTDEKKLNSEEFSNIENINFGDSLNIPDTFNNLYNLDDKSMRTIGTVNSLRANDNKSIVTGNKVLRTKIRTVEPIYSFNYSTMQTWLESSENPTWKEVYLGSKIITWPCYVKVLEEKSGETPVEWRMLEGKFKLNEQQLSLIKSKKVQPVIGIESENCNLILPFCDVLNVFINGTITDINYTSLSQPYKFKIDKNIGNYNSINTAEKNKYCNKEEDNILSEHTQNKHIDCNILKPTIGMDENYYKMVGDISQYIDTGTSEYKISLLIGQLGRIGETDHTYKGGTSKITLFLIENPQFKVSIKPYILNENNEKKYVDSDYKFFYNEKILFDVEIINESINFDYTNLDLYINLIKQVKGDKTKISDVLYINKNDAKYNDTNIKDSIKLYLNDENTSYSNTKLSNLNKGDKLTISSNKFVYTVTEYNALIEQVNYDYNLQLNYLNKYTFSKYTKTNRLQVNPRKGKLIVTVNGDEEDYFYLKLKGQENSSNIKVKSNEPCIIWKLDYDKTYELSLINSSSYKPIDSQNFVIESSSGKNEKSIIIDANPKPNGYFTQRKIDEIIINR